MKQKFLPLVAIAFYLSVPYANASVTQLDEVIVIANRNVYDQSVSAEETAKWLPGEFNRGELHLGSVGETNTMKVPYTATSLTQKTLDQIVPINGSIDQALANVPSIRIGTSPIKTDFSIRGMLANGSAMYLNNIPSMFIMASGPMSDMIGRADVVIGPAATLTGTVQSYNGPDGGQPGSVFLYSKRPDVNLTRFTETISGYGNYGEYLDVSRTGLGKNSEWGVRVLGQAAKGGLPISGAENDRKNVFTDISHEDERRKTNLFAGYFDDRLYGTERRFMIDRNGSRVPVAPDASMSYDDPDFMHQYDYGWMITFNHEQKINDHMEWFLNAGMNETTIRRFIYVSQVPIDDEGNLKGARVWSQHFFMKNRYTQLGFKTNFQTGIADHHVTASVDRSWRVHYNAKRADKKNEHVIGNIYTGITFKPSMYSYDNSDTLGNDFMYQEMDTGLNIMDSVDIDKWTVLAAINRRHGNYRGKAKENKVKDNHWAPTIGATYRPNDDLSFYGTWSRATTKSTAVYGGYDNDGEMLDPVNLTQKEVGLKCKFSGLLATLSYFDINQPNELEEEKDGKSLYTRNGKNRYKGVDFSVSGQLARKWNMFGGFQYLHARQESTAGGLMDGMPTDGSAKWSTVLGLEYMPNDALSILGRMNYVSSGIINGNTPGKELSVPSYTSYDLFINYKSHIGSLPVKWSASCYNLFDRSYWIHQPGQGSKLMLSIPRTFMISATIDF
ncbi:MAG: TonB-dependent receptor [Dialister sp.]|nr:TonB-dependent receptor [Dialister sp.]